MRHFGNWITKHNLIDFAPINGLYTWHNRRKYFFQLEVRLDRLTLKGDLRDFDHSMQSSILLNMRLDYFLVILEISKQQKSSRKPFKCENMWFQYDKFMFLIK